MCFTWEKPAPVQNKANDVSWVKEFCHSRLQEGSKASCADLLITLQSFEKPLGM
jgi:hypothetical protein